MLDIARLDFAYSTSDMLLTVMEGSIRQLRLARCLPSAVPQISAKAFFHVAS